MKKYSEKTVNIVYHIGTTIMAGLTVLIISFIISLIINIDFNIVFMFMIIIVLLDYGTRFLFNDKNKIHQTIHWMIYGINIEIARYFIINYNIILGKYFTDIYSFYVGIGLTITLIGLIISSKEKDIDSKYKTIPKNIIKYDILFRTIYILLQYLFYTIIIEYNIIGLAIAIIIHGSLNAIYKYSFLSLNIHKRFSNNTIK